MAETASPAVIASRGGSGAVRCAPSPPPQSADRTRAAHRHPAGLSVLSHPSRASQRGDQFFAPPRDMGFYRTQRQGQGLRRLGMGEFAAQAQQQRRLLFRRQGTAALWPDPASGRDRAGTRFRATSTAWPWRVSRRSQLRLPSRYLRQAMPNSQGRKDGQRQDQGRSARYVPRRRRKSPARCRRHRHGSPSAAAGRRAVPADACEPDARRRRPNRPWACHPGRFGIRLGHRPSILVIRRRQPRGKNIKDRKLLNARAAKIISGTNSRHDGADASRHRRNSRRPCTPKAQARAANRKARCSRLFRRIAPAGTAATAVHAACCRLFSSSGGGSLPWSA